MNAKSKRKAISPVLATVILIAITLVACVAVAGFVFGLMGTFTSIATVSAESASCSGTPEACNVILQNSGTGSTTITGACSLTFGGATYLGTATPVSTLVGGGSTTVRCTSNAAGSHAVAGSQITGSIVVGSGADVLFSAAAQ